ncbi:RfaG Glycosyltransferase [Candidatus Nanopelagicaceae bacterium]
MSKPSLLVVGMLDSTHLQKWISSVAHKSHFKHIWVFPSTSPKKISHAQGSKLINVIPFSNSRFIRGIFFVLDRFYGNSWRGSLLAVALRILRPNILHLHEIQHAGYIFTLSKPERLNKRSKVICSTWGSDLMYYGMLDNHKNRIEKTLSFVDLLLVERNEEIEIARKFGFSKDILSEKYATIGTLVKEESLIAPSKRTLILIKGYQDNHGRALNALRALELVQSNLRNYEIVVFSAAESVANEIELLRLKYNWKISSLPRVSREEMQAIYQRARICLGIGISDGLSNSMIESMEFGAFPIQSANSCAPHFLVDGVSGFIVDPWDLIDIAMKIDISLKDDALVDGAKILNRVALINLFNLELELNDLINIYEKILESSK